MIYILKSFIFIMSINSELQNLKFLLNVGISEFLQNKPNIRYHNEYEKNIIGVVIPYLFNRTDT